MIPLAGSADAGAQGHLEQPALPGTERCEHPLPDNSSGPMTATEHGTASFYQAGLPDTAMAGMRTAAATIHVSA